MKLGEILVRDGHVTPAQIDMALARQKRDGGRFGTLLVEMGFVDLETITMYLGLEMSLPVATGAALDRAKRTAVRLLSPEQAARFRCVPLMISERQLIAAVDDPFDMHTLDEISSITGYRVIPRVAPEIRIYYYIERYYGVPRPERYRVLGDSPRGERRPAPHAPGTPLPGPSLPGLPPQTDSPIAAPTPAPVLRAASPPPEPAPAAQPPAPTHEVHDEVLTPEEIGAIELEADELVVELEADAAETARQAPPAEAFEAMRHETDAEAETPHPPLELDAAPTMIREAMQRGEVAEAMMGYAAHAFEAAVLFIVRDNLAFGWKGLGPQVTRERVDALLIPLDAPSIFQAAVKADDRFYTGTAFPAAIHRYLFKVLRCGEPRQTVVATVTIGKRLVNVLYAHVEDADTIPPEVVTGVRQLVDEAAAAYIRLIAVSKRDDRE